MKEQKEILDGNTAAAYAAKLSRVQCIPIFPITPQTEFIDIISKWQRKKFFMPEYKVLESEHSVISAAVGSELTGARTFTFSGSQGILLMHEILYIAAGLRLPMVMVNGSRGLSAPITLWPDHDDFLAMRDTGWIMLATETNQELLDSIIMAFKVSENQKVMLPSLINMDGFIQSYTRTEVRIPEQKSIDKFLPPLKMKVKLDVKEPMTLGIPVMGEYQYFKEQVHKALLDSKEEIKKVCFEWKKLTGRSYDVVERFHLNDAKVAIVIMGANSTVAKASVLSLRKKGKKVGLLRLRLIRPFPSKEIVAALKNVKAVGVCDQNISPGQSGILYQEVKAALSNENKVVSNYIFGLGGRFVSEKDFEKVFDDLFKNKKEVRKWLQ